MPMAASIPGWEAARSTSPVPSPGLASPRLSSAGCPSDRFGRLLSEPTLTGTASCFRSRPADAPTTLAVVDVDPAGVPGYRFYLTGTAAAAIEPGQAIVPPATTALHVGTLGLVMEPIAASMEQLVTALPARHHGHARPQLPARRDRVPAGIPGPARPHRAPGRLVKMSTEDLAYLYPGARTPPTPPRTCSARDPPAWWSPTARRPYVRSPGTREIRVEVPPVEVVDTVGAGDAFGGAFLTWWVGNGLGRADMAEPSAVRGATQAAVYASAVTCTRRGAEPPWAHELAGHEGWDWLPPSPSPASQAGRV